MERKAAPISGSYAVLCPILGGDPKLERNARRRLDIMGSAASGGREARFAATHSPAALRILRIQSDYRKCGRALPRVRRTGHQIPRTASSPRYRLAALPARKMARVLPIYFGCNLPPGG